MNPAKELLWGVRVELKACMEGLWLVRVNMQGFVLRIDQVP